MAFVDEVRIFARAGNGGDGVVRWNVDKSKPRGGPAGGDGGAGADVYVEAVRDFAYLSNYRHTKSFAGEDGSDGTKKNMEGKNGEDLILKFPIGSLVTNAETDDVYELLHEGERIRILKGGMGGFGNTRFKNSRNVSPTQSTPGRPGERGNFHVELKLVADIGLIGLPNAGKSSLLNALTNAKSAIGAYPFTTLEPHLGSFFGYVLADIPGLIEGAADGKGLGGKFLRHISRTRVLFHLVSAEDEEVVERYKTIRGELSRHGDGLTEKREIVVLSKIDLVDPEEHKKYAAELREVAGEVWELSVEDPVVLKEFSKKLSILLEEERATIIENIEIEDVEEL
ncbi:GTPase ObgE [Candidatus Wolfebacteria bacterium]|nr:GTPase ObgE [Candidatus Wolfebacteria bacterium]